MGKRRIWSSTLFANDPPTYGADRQRTFQGLHDALLAVGWEQAADTGQLAGFTSTEIGMTPTTFGYRIYKLNDAFSVESPIYMKLVFYAASGSSAWSCFPDVRISIGNGTNGAGALLSATPERSMYEARATYAFDRATYPKVDTRSFAYSGEGISWFALNCGAITGTKTTSGTVARVSTGPDGNWPLRFFAVCRPMDESGGASAHGACLLTVEVPGMTSFSGAFGTGSGPVHMRADMLSQGGGVTTSTDIGARILPDLLKTEGTKAVAAPAYGLFSGIARKLCGIASVPAVTVSAMDTVELAVGGLVGRLMIAPHPGLNGFNRLDAVRNSGTAAYGSPEFDTLLLAWDGVDV